MNTLLKYIFLLAPFIFISSCTPTNKDAISYFGGKIINPKSGFVLLYHEDALIDSLTLDKEDTFIGSYKNFKEGLYSFKHGNEHQYVYFEPKDSILIRLNTWDFDETLVFSGLGAHKNNILIDWFLEGEREYKNADLLNMFRLKPTIFKSKMDSLLNVRQQKIDLFKADNNDLPKEYLMVLDIIVNYPIYIRFEEYPMYQKHYNQTKYFPEIAPDFYNFRKNININNHSLKYFSPLNNYITYRLYNTTYKKGFSSNSNEFTEALLNTIAENITDEKLKNIFLYKMLLNNFLNKSSCNLNKNNFNTYFKLSSDIEGKKQAQKILNDVKNLHAGEMLEDFKITDYLKTKRSVQKITKNKNSVVYFWNPTYISNARLIKRTDYLIKKFPKVNFILVKITDIDSDYVHGIDIKKQYYLEDSSKANHFLTCKIPRALLINEKGSIVNGYANISSPLFNKQVEKLQKQ